MNDQDIKDLVRQMLDEKFTVYQDKFYHLYSPALWMCMTKEEYSKWITDDTYVPERLVEQVKQEIKEIELAEMRMYADGYVKQLVGNNGGWNWVKVNGD